ncbi:MAG: hypothetical protein FDZ70_01160 [Actinobacteria bacterium]|nr:MAG: hypothetical protein FDZ70_01160 [Actinomycetota bacterium]
MVRINLLPPEIVEKRKAEKTFSYVALAGVAAVAVLLLVYGVALFIVGGRSQELQSKQDQAVGLQKQAEAFRVFETKEKDLADRQEIADEALSARIDWSRLFTEISLVLPSDMWASRIKADEERTPNVQVEGSALDPEDTPDSGHKVIAKALVRFADLDQLANVWLTKSEKMPEEWPLPTISFEITADVAKPAAADTGSAGAVPAPPTGP